MTSKKLDEELDEAIPTFVEVLGPLNKNYIELAKSSLELGATIGSESVVIGFYGGTIVMIALALATKLFGCPFWLTTILALVQAFMWGKYCQKRISDHLNFHRRKLDEFCKKEIKILEEADAQDLSSHETKH